MARTMDVAFVRQLEDMFYTFTQQQVSKLEPCITMKTGVQGKSVDKNRIGDAEAGDINDANSDTTWVTLAKSRRRANMQPKGWAHPLDSFDEAMLLTDPKNEITQKCVQAINRACDRHWIAALIGSAITVSAADAEGSQAITLTIADGGTSMTLDKIRQAMYYLDLYEVQEEDRFLVLSAYAKQSLLKYAEIGSRDYNPSVGAFISGSVPRLFGFQVVMSNLLAVASSIRSCIAFARAGFQGYKGVVEQISVGQRRDKWNAWEVQGKVIVGGVRMDENLVVQIDIDETA